MRADNPFRAVFQEYFSDTPIVREYTLVKAGIAPFLIGSITGFLTIGLDKPLYGVSLPVFLFLLGIFLTFLTILTHIVLYIVGQFYTNGVISSIASFLFFSSISVAVITIGSIAIFGGVFVGAAIFLWLLPTNTVFIPLNIIGFIAVAIWWYSKGLMILDEGQSFNQAMSVEMNLINKYLFN